MKQDLANFLDNPTNFLNDPRNQRILVISGFVILFSCLLFLLFGRATRRGETVSAEGMTAMPVSTTPTITPTKWWIMVTPTSSPAHRISQRLWILLGCRQVIVLRVLYHHYNQEYMPISP